MLYINRYFSRISMPPKVRISKQDIVDTAVQLTRTTGIQSVNARTVAAMLQCSTQPIFSNFSSMDALHQAVFQQANQLYDKYTENEIISGQYPTYKATGMAYIRFAKEERELFKLLFMRDRLSTPVPDDIGVTSQVESIIRNTTGLNGDTAKLFHLEMWAYVHGIATMFATGYLDPEWELVSKMITDAYQGLRKQYGLEG